MDEFTQKKFNEGELYDAYNYLGCVYDSDTKKATFRVYAPRAIDVHVVGDFNGWDNTATPMTRNESGIYEVEVENVEEYSNYKYYILTDTKGGIYKADPYAFHSETEGGTNSKVFDLSKIKINDEKYIKRRKRKNV